MTRRSDTRGERPRLLSNALGFRSDLVLGLASTAPAYSVTATLGFVAAIVGFQAPLVLVLSFLPIVSVAVAYYHMNRAEPDCGTSFAWVAKAIGPRAGWLAGWAIIVTGVIVMANLAQVAGLYSFLLLDVSSAASSTATVTATGVAWIAAMTVVCVRGVRLSARVARALLGAEIVALGLFAAVALVKVYTSPDANSHAVSLSWFSPFSIDVGPLTAGILLGVFIYWGWETAVSVNEETVSKAVVPGIAAVASTVLLVVMYLVISVAAVALGGPEQLTEHEDDVLAALAADALGSPLDKIVVLAVLTSAGAATLTTILPTARTALSMARRSAAPVWLAHIHPRYRTPANATVATGAAAVAWYVALTLISENLLLDSITAIGLMIAFYYALTAFACAWYHRSELVEGRKTLVTTVVVPLAGAVALTYVFIKSSLDLSDPSEAQAGAVLGVGAPLVIGAASLLLGLAAMFLQRARAPTFFRATAASASSNLDGARRL